MGFIRLVKPHLIRRSAIAAHGVLPSLTIVGSDWDTPDGICVRDYIHVRDLVTSIANAVETGPSNTPYGCLGSGKGYSVNEVLTSMKNVTGRNFNVIMGPRRTGDVASMLHRCCIDVASMICPSQYKQIQLSHDLDSMCLSAFEGLK